MRRSLVALVLASSLLWAAGGIAVLAVAAHEHLHHTAPHDHGRALRTAAHGHVHETEPDHDHHLAALPAVARAVSLVTVLAAAVMVPLAAQAPSSDTGRVVDSRGRGTARPPTYLANCALLT